MKYKLNSVTIPPIKNVPYKEVKPQINKNTVNNIEKDNIIQYKSEFIKEMFEIEKEKPITITKYEDLFDDE